MLRFGAFQIEPRTWTLARDGRTIDLSPRLVEILACLALDSFNEEIATGASGHVYAREFAANARVATGAIQLAAAIVAPLRRPSNRHWPKLLGTRARRSGCSRRRIHSPIRQRSARAE
jgi:hypothetical protein